MVCVPFHLKLTSCEFLSKCIHLCVVCALHSAIYYLYTCSYMYNVQHPTANQTNYWYWSEPASACSGEDKWRIGYFVHIILYASTMYILHFWIYCLQLVMNFKCRIPNSKWSRSLTTHTYISLPFQFYCISVFCLSFQMQFFLNFFCFKIRNP